MFFPAGEDIKKFENYGQGTLQHTIQRAISFVCPAPLKIRNQSMAHIVENFDSSETSREL